MLVSNSMIDIMGKVTPKDIKDTQVEDLDTGKVIWYAHAGKNLTLM